MKIQPGLEALNKMLALLFQLVPNTKEPFRMAILSVKAMFISTQTVPFWS